LPISAIKACHVRRYGRDVSTIAIELAECRQQAAIGLYTSRSTMVADLKVTSVNFGIKELKL
jgi:hypothetical protein